MAKILNAGPQVNQAQTSNNAPPDVSIISELSRGYLGVTSVILLTTDSVWNDQIMQVKKLASLGIMSSATSIQNFSKQRKGSNHLKETVIVNAIGQPLGKYEQLTKEVSMSRFNWIFFSDADANNFSEFNLPYNCKFLLARSLSNREILLTELYKILPGDSVARANVLGSWRATSGVAFRSKTAFYTRRLNLHGAMLPYLTNKIDACADISVAEGLTIPCIHEKVWKLIVETLNATTKPIYLSQRLPQFLSKEFQEGHAQAAICAVYLSSESVALVDFFWPTLSVHLYVFTQFSGTEISWSRYLKPFSYDIWFAIVAWIILCCGVFEVARRLAMNFCPYEKGLTNWAFHQIWSPIFAFFFQGSTEPADRIWERLLLLSAFLAPAVLLPAYNAALTSFLAIHAPEMPFTALEEMPDHKQYKLSPVKGFRLAEILERGNDMTSQYLLKHALVPYDQQPETSVEGFKRMCKERFSYIETEYAMAALKPACKFYKLRRPIASYHVSMVMPKNSSFETPFNYVSTMVRFSGVLLRLKYALAKNQIMTLFLEEKDSSEIPAIDFESIVLLLATLGFGVILALQILFVEIVVSKIARKKKAEVCNKLNKREVNVACPKYRFLM